MKLLKIAAFLGILTLSSLGFGQLQIGSPAPDFTVTDTTGKTQKLKDYAGKIVVLEWYNKDCPYVRKHYDSKNMQSLQANAKKSDIVWLTIISSAPGKQGHEAPSAAQKTASQEGSQATAILIDDSGKIGKSYSAKTTPHMFVISKEGNLVYQGAIDSNSSSNPKTIPNSTNYVSAALDSLQKGEPVKVSQTKPYGCSVKY